MRTYGAHIKQKPLEVSLAHILGTRSRLFGIDASAITVVTAGLSSSPLPCLSTSMEKQLLNSTDLPLPSRFA